MSKCNWNRMNCLALAALLVSACQPAPVATPTAILRPSDTSVAPSTPTPPSPTDTPSVTDIDGNIYNIVTIGTQTWMKENLRTTRYSNGDIIGTTDPATKDIRGESDPKYQWAYTGANSNVPAYGRLYTWYAATDSRNICPTGWHVPNDAEWTALMDYLGGDRVAGGELKEAGTMHWNDPNTGATNASGFTALPSGDRFADGTFDGFGYNGSNPHYGFWWSSSERDNGNFRYMDYESTVVENSNWGMYNSTVDTTDSKKFGYAVRCLKGTPELPADTNARTSISSQAPTLPPSTPSPMPAGVSFLSNGQKINFLLGGGVAFGDLDGDGDLDAFATSRESPDGKGHRVYLNDGGGQFSDSGQQLLDESTLDSNPAIGDVNGDGKLEVITGATIWLNDGQGNFSAGDEKLDLPDASDGTYGFIGKLADLNGDGYLDVLGALLGDDSRLQVYLNNGGNPDGSSGIFQNTGQSLGGGAIYLLELGDINGDGFVDAVTAGWRAGGSIDSPNRIWLNDGQGNFSDSGQILDESNRHVHGLAIGDIEHNGTLDIVLGMTSSPYLKTYLNDGQGNFTASGQSFGNAWVSGLDLGDLDGDGNLDIFATSGDCSSGTPLPLPGQVWLNDGQGNFGDSSLRLGKGLGSDVELDDFNGDGKLDAFVFNWGWDAACNCQRGAPAEIWLNTTPTVVPTVNRYGQ